MEGIIYLIGGIGILVGVVGITLFLLSQKEVKSLIKQLEEINKRETNQKVQIISGNKLYKQLVIKMNEMITEQKNTQKEYIRMERELKETIANLSHDLRTPLTSMLGYLQLLEKKEITDEKKEQYLHIIKGRAENLQGLVENFYELSQIRSNIYTLEYQEIHIDRMICELIANFYQDFVDKNLEIQVDIPKELPTIYADEKAVIRILLNLIQNTLRYAQKQVQVSLIKKDEYIQLEIINEAGSISKEDVNCLFERFFMANRVRNGEGTGVGLAVVKQLMTMMGGEAEAELRGNQIAIIVRFRINGCR